MKKFDDNEENTTKSDQLIHFILSHLLYCLSIAIFMYDY